MGSVCRPKGWVAVALPLLLLLSSAPSGQALIPADGAFEGAGRYQYWNFSNGFYCNSNMWRYALLVDSEHDTVALSPVSYTGARSTLGSGALCGGAADNYDFSSDCIVQSDSSLRCRYTGTCSSPPGATSSSDLYFSTSHVVSYSFHYCGGQYDTITATVAPLPWSSAVQAVPWVTVDRVPDGWNLAIFPVNVAPGEYCIVLRLLDTSGNPPGQAARARMQVNSGGWEYGWLDANGEFKLTVTGVSPGTTLKVQYWVQWGSAWGLDIASGRRDVPIF